MVHDPLLLEERCCEINLRGTLPGVAMAALACSSRESLAALVEAGGNEEKEVDNEELHDAFVEFACTSCFWLFNAAESCGRGN
jgi:hypothetical protein